ncbi:MAG TPA: fused MFS/spermidine synthase [Vicinamibacterales bacterium]|jgi:spermidine synthase|nr:fused MFS/spermidine synthase [Vicinamibacterales bacterium]
MVALLLAAFFLSGISGLVYQVTWVRQFGNVFGNTVHSASIVVAVFMLGLGAGGYLAGAWTDRHVGRESGRLVRLYAWAEALLACLGLALSLVLPHLAALVAGWSHYVAGTDGWLELSAASYAVRVALAIGLLAPVTLTMGATLTLLIRALLPTLEHAGWTVARLYGANTAGAAAGALLTDFALVRMAGFQAAQLTAVVLNLVAAGLAWSALRLVRVPDDGAAREPAATDPPVRDDAPVGSMAAAAIALALAGCAAMGFEMLWLRHFSILLGGFRAVFSLVLAVLLVAGGAGALAGGWLQRRVNRPADLLVAAYAIFVAAALGGLAWTSASGLAARGEAVAAVITSLSPARRVVAELWFNLRPMLVEVGLPAFVAGASYPLANAIVQRSGGTIGRRAGLLYLANTAGAVCGSLAAGYLLLPWLGMQAAALVLVGLAAVAVVTLRFAGASRVPLVAAAAFAVVSIGAWTRLPGDYVLQRALLVAPGDHVLTESEGTTEVIAVVEAARGRALLTNGHAMSSTAVLDQRYMRALAHVPLLSMPAPRRVLVIGFGVGNTVHAATLHPSVDRVDVAELSRHVLAHATYFRDANGDVLRHPKVRVYLNDGRQHLEMAAPGSYDLVTLEPPPIAHAGVAALYSREFYRLVRSRLTPGGYVSQWLPAYQVPGESSLAMVRAFLDVFPQAVLLSGTQAELLLLGTSGPRIEIEPGRLREALDRAPAVRADLARLDLAEPRDIVGAFVGAAATLTVATRTAPAVTDDRPIQEYGVLSGLSTGLQGVPAALFDLDAVASWCPRCFENGRPVPAMADLDAYMGLMREAYEAPVSAVETAARAGHGRRRFLGSGYLGQVVPETAEVYNIAGTAERRQGRLGGAVAAFETALRLEPASPAARQNLGQIRLEQGRALLEARRFADAAAALREAIALLPSSAAAHNDLGVALASVNDVVAAAAQFRQAVVLNPDFVEARRNLTAAEALMR